MNRLTLVLAGYLVLVASIAHAGWSGVGTVLNVYSHNGTNHIVTTITDNPCTQPGKFWWPATDPEAKDMLAISLMALATDKRIAVVYDPAAPNCSSGGAAVTHIMIAK